MARIIYQSRDAVFAHAISDLDSLWLDGDEIESATGWHWKPEGLCRDASCIPIPRLKDLRLVDGYRLDMAGMWRYLGWPVVHDRTGMIWLFGEGASLRASSLNSLQAPDFELPDLNGELHRLSDYQGRRIFMVSWASWCGCRADLTVWQSLQEIAAGHHFTVLAIALDKADAARPWIEAATPSYPCLIDRDHLTAELYNLVNVPQAVWIDESGRIVRPPETAGLTDHFRAMDRKTFLMPESAREERDRAKTAYLSAVREWAIRGAASPFVLDEKAVMARLKIPDSDTVNAHAHFRLGQALLRDGRIDEARVEFAEASKLHPESWAIWRQTASKNENGLAIGDDFWKRVDALGDQFYYAPTAL